jgi:hypothetical protein
VAKALFTDKEAQTQSQYRADRACKLLDAARRLMRASFCCLCEQAQKVYIFNTYLYTCCARLRCAGMPVQWVSFIY